MTDEILKPILGLRLLSDGLRARLQSATLDGATTIWRDVPEVQVEALPTRERSATPAGKQRTIVLAMEIVVAAPEDHSGLTEDELARQVWDAVEPERNELAAEARIAAHNLLNGYPARE